MILFFPHPQGGKNNSLCQFLDLFSSLHTSSFNRMDAYVIAEMSESGLEERAQTELQVSKSFASSSPCYQGCQRTGHAYGGQFSE